MVAGAQDCPAIPAGPTPTIGKSLPVGSSWIVPTGRTITSLDKGESLVRRKLVQLPLGVAAQV